MFLKLKNTIFMSPFFYFPLPKLSPATPLYLLQSFLSFRLNLIRMFGQSLSCQKQSTKLKLCNKNRNSNTHPITTGNLASYHYYNNNNSCVVYIKKQLPKDIKQSAVICAINGSILLVIISTEKHTEISSHQKSAGSACPA